MDNLIKNAIENNKKQLTVNESLEYIKLQTECYIEPGREEKKFGNAIRRTVKDVVKEWKDNYMIDYNIPTILDIGCGEGVALNAFYEEFSGKCSLYGFDINYKKSFDTAKRLQNIASIKPGSDMHEQHYNLNKFDIIYCSHSLEHCWDLSLVLSHIHYSIKPNGLHFAVLPFEPDNKNEKGKGNAHTHPFSSLEQIKTDMSTFFSVYKVEKIDRREPEYAVYMKPLHK